MTEKSNSIEGAAPNKEISEVARRALEEAAERRKNAEQDAAEAPKEINGPSGPEPTRFGDWERKGVISDF